MFVQGIKIEESNCFCRRKIGKTLYSGPVWNICRSSGTVTQHRKLVKQGWYPLIVELWLIGDSIRPKRCIYLPDFLLIREINVSFTHSILLSISEVLFFINVSLIYLNIHLFLMPEYFRSAAKYIDIYYIFNLIPCWWLYLALKHVCRWDILANISTYLSLWSTRKHWAKVICEAHGGSLRSQVECHQTVVEIT